MQKVSSFIPAIILLSAVSAHAELISTAELTSDAGSIVFELYDDSPLIAECRGTNSLGATANLKTDKGMVPYGTGCWTADAEGYIHLRIKSLDDGQVRESSLHNSKFTSAKNPPAKKELSLMGIRADDPVWEGWQKASPIYSVLDNCKVLQHLPPPEGDKSRYEFAAMDSPNDIFYFQTGSDKSKMREVFAKSETACERVLEALQNAKAIGINTKNTVRFGIATDDLPPADRKKGKKGALVTDVFQASAARRAGVRKGDVIVAVNGQAVIDSLQASSAMRALPLSTQKATLGIVRQGVRKNLEVKFTP